MTKHIASLTAGVLATAALVVPTQAPAKSTWTSTALAKPAASHVIVADVDDEDAPTPALLERSSWG